MTIREQKQTALAEHLNSSFANKYLPLFVSPRDFTPLVRSKKGLSTNEGEVISVENGVLDFLTLSKNITPEKKSQIDFHDDEEKNETLEEIVERPYNGNSVHIKSWLYHLNYFKKILPEKLGITLNETSILNCGCGGGFEAQFFAENGADVVGFDVSRLRVEASITRFYRMNLPGLFYRGEASILPFKDNSFDLVIYHDSLHHVPIEEIPIAIKEAVRVAKKGIVLLEAHDTPFRMLLESCGISTSIEPSGNYTFRFRRNLLEYWAAQTSTQLVNYTTHFTKKEHRPRFYAIPILGGLLYGLVRFAGIFLKPLGNEACIILRKG